MRVEGWRNFAFLPDEDDVFGLGRLLLFVDARVNEAVSVRLEGKSALATDRNLPGGVRLLDEDELDLHQAYVDLNLGQPSMDVSLRVGRQTFGFGRQRTTDGRLAAAGQSADDDAAFNPRHRSSRRSAVS